MRETPGLELERVRHFVLLAKTLHFGMAATQLDMEQSKLTRSIQRLELSIGAKLLKRSRRHVSLTPAGAAFRDEAERILREVERIARTTRETASGRMGEVRLAIDRTTAHGFPALAIKQFRASAPGVAVKISTRPSDTALTRLREGDLDIVLTFRAMEDRKDMEGLEHTVVRRYTHVIAAPASWPVCAQSSVRLQDLADLPFIMYAKEAYPRSHGTFISLCAEAGFTPRVVQDSNQLGLTLGLVDEQVGVALVVELNHPPPKGVKLLRVAGLSDRMHAEGVAAWDPARARWPVRAMLDELALAGAADERATGPVAEAGAEPRRRRV